jgi:hypothetical protein
MTMAARRAPLKRFINLNRAGAYKLFPSEQDEFSSDKAL